MEPIKIKDIIPAILNKKGLKDKILEETIREKWLEIAGPDIFQKTVPGSIKNHKLTVYAYNSVWMQELNVKYKQMLFENIRKNTSIATIKDIVFKIKN